MVVPLHLALDSNYGAWLEDRLQSLDILPNQSCNLAGLIAEGPRQEGSSPASLTHILGANGKGFFELGILTQGGLSENLDEVIFALQEGEISAPVPGPSGYHIFQVLEVVAAGPPPREEVEPDVLRRLGEIAAREHAAECVQRLAYEVGVNVIDNRLWFNYQGRYAEEIHAS